MHVGLALGCWPVLALALPAAGLVVRVFALQHDCGHGSFFRSRRRNDAVGRFCALVTFTPYRALAAPAREPPRGLQRPRPSRQRRRHLLDLRDVGRSTGRCRRCGAGWYRPSRHPLLTPAAAAAAGVPGALPPAVRRAGRGVARERRSVHLTHAAILLALGALGWAFGARAVLLVHLPIMALASIVGVWLFSVQHRFEEALWARGTAGTSPTPRCTAAPT